MLLMRDERRAYAFFRVFYMTRKISSAIWRSVSLSAPSS